MERLSVASSLAVGHEMTIFSYEPKLLRQQGLGVPIEDAREVLFDASLGPLQENKPDHFSDHFRLEALAKGLGTWTDLDFIFIRPLQDHELIIALTEPAVLANAPLRLPAESPVLAEYLALCRQRPVRSIAPWWPWHRKASRYLKVVSKKLRGRPVLAMHYGPPALTHFVSKHGLMSHAAPIDAYFSVPPPWAGRLYLEPRGIEPYLTPRTRAVHLWHSIFRREYGEERPHPESWLGKKCREFGIA